MTTTPPRAALEALAAGLEDSRLLTDPDVTASYANDMASFCRPVPPPSSCCRARSRRSGTCCASPPRCGSRWSRRAPAPACPAAPTPSEGCIVLSLDEDGPDPGDRPVDRIAVVEPGVINATCPRAAASTGCVPARPVQLGVLHDRRQPRDQRGRPVLREVRRDRATTCSAWRWCWPTAGRCAPAAARSRASPGYDLTAPVRRLRGHARRHHRGDPAAAPGAAAAGDVRGEFARGAAAAGGRPIIAAGIWPEPARADRPGHAGPSTTGGTSGWRRRGAMLIAPVRRRRRHGVAGDGAAVRRRRRARLVAVSAAAEAAR